MSDASRSKSPASTPSQPVVPTLVPATTVSLSAADQRNQALLMRACRREPVERTPVWLMRQAGRYLPEYRRVREQVDFMGLVKNPRLAAEVMIATVERLGVDAAIIFSDLLPILEPMGMNLEFTAGEGPVIHNPIREPADVQRLRELDDLDPLGYVMDVVRATRAGLDDSLPVIGFAGAPFTLAGYCIEGGTSKAWLHTKSLMYRHESAWHDLMDRIARAVSRYLVAQLDAGAQLVQLFDSWVGCLSPHDYRRYVLPHSRTALHEAAQRAPVIHFATGNPSLLPLLAEAGGSVIGIDWRIDLGDAWRLVGHDRAVQGNLDPVVLLSDRETVRRQTQHVLAQAAGRPGHIFNLGHGILPQTPVDNVLELIATVKGAERT
jgi:uroporphyrinogen decarboxylase